MTTSPRTFGYDANFSPPLKKRLECPICLLAQKDPLQTPCGHRFCANCIDNALRLTGQRCPIDNKALSLTQLFPDNFARREVLSLSVLCNNSKPGCVWKGELRELEDHLCVCQFIEIKCPFSCGSIFTRDRFSTHQQECEKKPVPCLYCEIVFPSEQIEEHQPFCSKTKPQPYIQQLLLQLNHKLLKWTGHIQLLGHTPTTLQAHFFSFDSQEINTIYWPPNLKFAIQSGSKECEQSLDLGKRMNQIVKVDFITDRNQNMENFFVEKMFYVCRISYSKKKKNDLILQLVWDSEKRECVLCVFKDANIKFLTKKMENRNLSGTNGLMRNSNSSHAGQVWPPVAGISINSAIPRINVAPDILLSQAPPTGVNPGNTPVITQPVWSPLLVYPSLLSAYVGTPNILTYSQLNTSPINFPSTYMDTASYFILDGQNSSSIAHTHVNPVDPVDGKILS
ncbi:TNF receptor-associated factor 6 [Oopsacas minuta]|uniref:TNF receptor-associated factor 6 n=1 Tax=Oopsacas minuta TaxID=111878 RepID=A0AAV7JR74_9METZ|nr:TNF receptor-associated factor 6 [Oopsacas minuta]